MRVLPLIPLVAAVPLVGGCDTFVSSHDPEFPPLHGSYAAHEAVYTTAGLDRLDEGWVVGIRFIPQAPGSLLGNEFIVIEVPPESEFAEPIISTGTFELMGEGQAELHAPDGTLLDRMEFVAEADAVMRFDFEGGLGFERLRTVQWAFYEYQFLTGLYYPERFLLTNAEGDSIDLAAEPGASLLLNLQPFWGEYQMSLEAPAGLLADTAVSRVYQGEFNSVGTLMILRPGLGCDVFAGEAVLDIRVEFSGYACEIAGEPYWLSATFRR